MNKVEIPRALLYRAGRALCKTYRFSAGYWTPVPVGVLVAEDRSVMIANASYMFAALTGDHFPEEWYLPPEELVPGRPASGMASVPLDPRDKAVRYKREDFERVLAQAMEVPNPDKVPPCLFNFRYGVLATEQLGSSSYPDTGTPICDAFYAKDKWSFGWKQDIHYGDTVYHEHVVIAAVVI